MIAYLALVATLLGGMTPVCPCAPPKNIRILFQYSGVVDVDIAHVPTSLGIEAYVEMVEAAVDKAVPAEAWSFNMTWFASERRVIVDNSGDGRMLIVEGDPSSAWPSLGFLTTTTFGILPAIGEPLFPDCSDGW